MDCSGTCYGNSFEDNCGICDENYENNNATCSGCTDSNAENFDENALLIGSSTFIQIVEDSLINC